MNVYFRGCMSMYMYLQVVACIGTCLYMYVYVHAKLCMYLRACTCMYVKYVYVHVSVYRSIYMYV